MNEILSFFCWRNSQQKVYNLGELLSTLSWIYWKVFLASKQILSFSRFFEYFSVFFHILNSNENLSFLSHGWNLVKGLVMAMLWKKNQFIGVLCTGGAWILVVMQKADIEHTLGLGVVLRTSVSSSLFKMVVWHKHRASSKENVLVKKVVGARSSKLQIAFSCPNHLWCTPPTEITNFPDTASHICIFAQYIWIQNASKQSQTYFFECLICHGRKKYASFGKHFHPFLPLTTFLQRFVCTHFLKIQICIPSRILSSGKRQFLSRFPIPVCGKWKKIIQSFYLDFGN